MSDKDDLTRIEDLSEYLHEDDPATELHFEKTTATQTATLSELPDNESNAEESIDDFSDETEEIETTSFEEETQTEILENDLEEIPPVSFKDETSDDTSFEFEENEDNDDEEFLPTKDEFSDESLEDDFTPLTNENVIEEEENVEEEDDTASFATPPPFPEEPSIEDEEAETLETEDLPQFQEEEINESEYSPAPIKITTEKFDDVKNFGQNISYGIIASGGNPPFSLMIKNIKYKDDSEDILILLREHGIINNDNETIFNQSIQNGALLISQISEYSAIYLAHKLRRFDIDISFGLSEELHQSKSYSNDDFKGLVSKRNLSQNREESLSIEDRPSDIDSIITSTTPTLENYTIERYIEVVTEHAIVNSNDLDPSQNKINHIYKELARNLSQQAFKLNGNAVVSISYQLNPLVDPSASSEIQQYKVTCTGNVVWVS